MFGDFSWIKALYDMLHPSPSCPFLDFCYATHSCTDTFTQWMGYKHQFEPVFNKREKKLHWKNGGSAEHTMQIGLLNDIKGIKAINW